MQRHTKLTVALNEMTTKKLKLGIQNEPLSAESQKDLRSSIGTSKNNQMQTFGGHQQHLCILDTSHMIYFTHEEVMNGKARMYLKFLIRSRV